MLIHLIRKEILDHILGHRFLALLGIGVFAVSLSLLSGYQYHQERLDDYRNAQKLRDLRLKQIDESEEYVYEPFYELGHVGFREHKPPRTLSIFVPGLDPVLGQSILNTAYAEMSWSPVELEPILGLFPPIGLGYVVEFLISLLVLMMTYDAVCGEKERGTLRLANSFGLSRPTYLLAKAIGAMVPALVIFGLPLLGGIAVMSFMPNLVFTGQDWLTLAVLFTVFVTYMVATASAGLLASALSSRSSTAFILVLAYWVASVVVIPRLSLILADTIRSSPSRYEHLSKTKLASRQIYCEGSEEHKAWWIQQAAIYPEWPAPGEQKAKDMIHFHATNAKSHRKTDIALNRLNEEFRNRHAARLNLATWYAKLSPTFTLRVAALRLAESGIDWHENFKRIYKEAYRRDQYTQWFRRIADRINLQRAWSEKYGEPNWSLDEFPRFQYQKQPTGTLVATLYDIGILCLTALFLLSAAIFAVLRYDVR